MGICPALDKREVTVSVTQHAVGSRIWRRRQGGECEKLLNTTQLLCSPVNNGVRRREQVALTALPHGLTLHVYSTEHVHTSPQSHCQFLEGRKHGYNFFESSLVTGSLVGMWFGPNELCLSICCLLWIPVLFLITCWGPQDPALLSSGLPITIGLCCASYPKVTSRTSQCSLPGAIASTPHPHSPQYIIPTHQTLPFKPITWSGPTIGGFYSLDKI